MSDTVVIENNTSAFILLFPTDGFPQGIRLLPGNNDVPVRYLEELKEHAVTTEARGGKPGPIRYPGREVLESLQTPITYYTVDGKVRGPRITIYERDQVARPEGPMAPIDLKAYKDEAAKIVIKTCSDKAALKRWMKDNRQEIAAAAGARLAELG